MKWLPAIFLFSCLSACIGHEERELLGPTLLDSSSVMLKSNGSLRNIEKARILVVTERYYSEQRGTPPDSCGSPSLQLTADVKMRDGRHFVFSGHGASPCNAGARPITDTIDLRSDRSEGLPKDEILSIHLRSNKPVALTSIEWQTWLQGI